MRSARIAWHFNYVVTGNNLYFLGSPQRSKDIEENKNGVRMSVKCFIGQRFIQHSQCTPPTWQSKYLFRGINGT